MSTPSSTPAPPRAPAAPPPAPAPALRGLVRDTGAERHDAVHAARWTLSGTAKVTGDVAVGEARLRGLAAVGGRLTADRLTVHGTLEVVGPVEVRGSGVFEGTFRPMGPVHLGAGNVRGIARVARELRVDRMLQVAGALEAPSVRAGLLELQGSANIPGEIVSLSGVHARFRGDSSLGPITARDVVLRGPPPGLVPSILRRVFGGAAHVMVERIEADRVELSAVTVAYVRAPSVVLGPGAHVTEVVGTIVRQHPSAHVGPESRSRPPHGLSP